MTARQTEVLEFIRQFIQNNGFAPSYHELADGIGVSSISTVHKHLKTLERKKLIELTRCKQRSIAIRSTGIQGGLQDA